MGRIGVVALALVLSGVAAHAGIDRFNITAEEHAACDGDAISYCAAAYPNEERMLSCMKANLTRLSATCSAAFTSGLKRRHLAL